MGCPGGTRSVFTCAFRAKRELQCIFLGKMAIIITSKHGTLQIFLGKLKEKLFRKACVNTGRVYRIVLMLLGNPIIFLKSNKFDMACVSVKRFIGKDRNMMVNLVPAEYMRKLFCQSVTQVTRLPKGAASVTFRSPVEMHNL